MQASENTDDSVSSRLAAPNHSASRKLDLVRRLAREKLLAIDAIASADEREENRPFARALQTISRLCGVALIVFATTVLFGWVSRFEVLLSIFPTVGIIVPLKASAFLFAGIAVLLICRKSASKARGQITEYLFALLPLVIGSITLCEYWTERSIIDLLLLPERVSAAGGDFPGRMSPLAALNFTVAGSALLMLALRIRSLGAFITAGALFVFFSSLISFLAFLFSTPDYGTFSWFDRTAVNASGAFMLLAGAIAFAHPELPLTRLIGGDSQGSKIARILFPASILTPTLIGFGIVMAERAEIFEAGVAAMLGAGSSVFLLFALVWLTAVRLDRADGERNQSARRLEHSEQLLRTLVEATSDFVWAQNESIGRGYADWWKQLTGQSDDEFSNEGWLSAVHPEDRDRVRKSWETSLATGTEFNDEYRVRLKSGEYGTFRVRGIPIKTGTGQVIEWVGTFDDVTAIRAAEAAVRDSERKFRILATAFEDSVWEIFSLDVEMAKSPKWWQDLTGQTDEEVKNYGWLSAVHPDDAEDAAKIIGSGFRNRSTWTHTFRIRRKDGFYRHYRSRCVPIFDEKGNFLQWIGSSRDVTAEKEAEQHIISLNRQLTARTQEMESLISELSAFTYSVSHDLRAPLRAMEGFSVAVLEDYADKLDQTGRNYLERIRNASLRMSEMIDALLTLSRLTRNPLKIETIDLSAMADEIIELFRQGEPQRNVNVAIMAGMISRGDPRMIRIALQNLLGNAWKFTSNRSDAKIEFGAVRSGEETIYFVRDNGVGFDMAYVHKLFAPFQRLHRADEFAGSGIGLATVQRIIRSHGGTIRAEGKPGCGAVFYFTLGTLDTGAK